MFNEKVEGAGNYSPVLRVNTRFLHPNRKRAQSLINILFDLAAVVLRLAPTWFRIGSLEILQYHQEMETLRYRTVLFKRA